MNGRHLRVLSGALLGLFLAGCAGGVDIGRGLYDMRDLTLQLEGFDPHVGRMLRIHVIHTNSGYVEDCAEIDPIVTGDFSVVFEEILIDGESYHVEVFVDANGNGLYDRPPTDPAWRLLVQAVSGDTIATLPADTSTVDIQHAAPCP